MARKSYKKRYYKKGRWSANILKIQNTTLQAAAGNWSSYTILTSNPIQSNTTVSQQYTVKNVELTFQMETGDALGRQLESITVYIMYVPQGMNIGDDYHIQHPEYIMAYRFIGSPEYEQPSIDGPLAIGVRNPLKVKTRLSRRLQTGDSIIAYFEGTNQSSDPEEININGLIRWWTKAN